MVLNLCTYQEEARAHERTEEQHDAAEVRVAHARRRCRCREALVLVLVLVLAGVLPLQEPEVGVDRRQVQPPGLGALEQPDDLITYASLEVSGKRPPGHICGCTSDMRCVLLTEATPAVSWEARRRGRARRSRWRCSNRGVLTGCGRMKRTVFVGIMQ